MRFEKKESEIILKVGSGYPISNWEFTFTLQGLTNEPYRNLLFSNLIEHFSNNLESIRRNSYERGWKDAKSKKRKETWFSSIWKENL